MASEPSFTDRTPKRRRIEEPSLRCVGSLWKRELIPRKAYDVQGI